MTELQRTELEILNSFITVCGKLNLTFYLVCGSALGAVKYGGFIPWDDDIDVAMPRRDYEMFLSSAQALLPGYYFIQNYRTERDCPFFYTKLRDSRTTFIEKSVRDIKINHGVYMDIFPLDGYPDVPCEIKHLERQKKSLTLKIASAFAINKTQKRKVRLFFRAERLLGCHRRTKRYTQKLDKLYAKYSLENSALWCNHGNWQGKLEYAPKEQYGSGAWAVFEGIKVRIPERYDDYLTQKYGDWRADLPDSEKQGHHYCEVCDLSRPYTYYC